MAISEVTQPSTQEARTRRLMRIRELDPQKRCGSGTTVTQLYLVDRLPHDPGVQHLVFFDRHGWYCVHGRDCPAVLAAQQCDKKNGRKTTQRTIRTR
jgi:hypothetical protein